MKVLSIDASTKSSGFAIFDNKNLKHYKCVTASSNDLATRIKKMVNALDEILTQNKIDVIVLEEVRPEQGLQNIKTHKALMYLQGAFYLLIKEKYKHIKIEFLYPNEWRSKCGIKTGAGVLRSSLKLADIKFVKDTYEIEVNDDIADAIGIGHAYVYENSQPEIVDGFEFK